MSKRFNEEIKLTWESWGWFLLTEALFYSMFELFSSALMLSPLITEIFSCYRPSETCRIGWIWSANGNGMGLNHYFQFTFGRQGSDKKFTPKFLLHQKKTSWNFIPSGLFFLKNVNIFINVNILTNYSCSRGSMSHREFDLSANQHVTQLELRKNQSSNRVQIRLKSRETVKPEKLKN